MLEMVNHTWFLPEELHNLALGGDGDVVEELIALFKQDIGERLLVLREAVQQNDLVVIASVAHTIKGSSAQMGAMNLVTTCRHLELDATNHVTGNLIRLLQEAEIEFRVLQQSMKS